MQNENLIYGINPIQQLLTNNPARIIEIYASKNKNDQRSEVLLTAARENDIAVQSIDPKTLDKWFPGQNHQGFAAKLKNVSSLTEKDLTSLVASCPNPLFLILDGVQDPHNLGACLRTADAAGVTAVIIPQDNAVSLTPAVRKVASGGAESVALVRVGNLARALKTIQDLGVWIVGTDGESEQSIYSLDLRGSIGVVLGAEGKGMRDLTRKHCDYLVQIPMAGQVESLNVSVATGVCLYEAVRQRLSVTK